MESMFYVREKPWHGLGTMVAEAPDSAAALRLAGLDWILRGEMLTNPVAPIKETLMKRIVRKNGKTVEEPDVVVPSEAEEERFVKEALAVRDKTGCYKYSAGLYGLLLLYIGMRIGEALASRYKDIDFEHGILTMDKSVFMVRNHDEKTNKRQVMMVVVQQTHVMLPIKLFSVVCMESLDGTQLI